MHVRSGALPADNPAITRHGATIPINHIVVLMQENRSFDHYMGRLHYQGKRRSEGEPKTASNPDPLGGSPITAFHQSRYCEVADLDHSWNGTHREWNNGAMDGFAAENVDPDDPSGTRTMGYYDRTDLRFIEARFDLPALTSRDANADPLLEMFDFRRARFRKPPKLPDAVIDQDRFQQCMNP